MSTEVDRAIYLGGNGLDMLPRVDPDIKDAVRAAPTFTRELYDAPTSSTCPVARFITADTRLYPLMPK